MMSLILSCEQKLISQMISFTHAHIHVHVHACTYFVDTGVSPHAMDRKGYRSMMTVCYIVLWVHTYVHTYTFAVFCVATCTCTSKV